MSETTLAPAREDPMERFREFYEEAVATGMDNPNAMVVSSVDAEGRPSEIQIDSYANSQVQAAEAIARGVASGLSPAP